VEDCFLFRLPGSGDVLLERVDRLLGPDNSSRLVTDWFGPVGDLVRIDSFKLEMELPRSVTDWVRWAMVLFRSATDSVKTEIAVFGTVGGVAWTEGWFVRACGRLIQAGGCFLRADSEFAREVWGLTRNLDRAPWDSGALNKTARSSWLRLCGHLGCVVSCLAKRRWAASRADRFPGRPQLLHFASFASSS
jgi:hypothetical protein